MLDFSTMNEETQIFFNKSTSEQLKKMVSSMPPEQIKIGIIALQNGNIQESTSKLIAIIQGIENNSQIENIGRYLSDNQFLILLEAAFNDNISSEKLSPLLVGLPYQTFYEVLKKATSDDIEIFKTEGLLEPLQHHLYLFANECKDLLNSYQREITDLEIQIEQIDRDTLTFQDIEDLKNAIIAVSDLYKNIIEATDKALAITWNTTRIDLIEKLTIIKETSQYQLVKAIGFNESPEGLSTGLFAKLQTYLDSIYSPSNEEEYGVDTLQNEDVSLEGLAKFSIWYLKDYWNLGLLPNITSAEDLDRSSQQYEEVERVKYRQGLFMRVQDNLNKLGIGTVGDLKKAQIYSKNMLKEYISANKKVLK
ncbi:MAG: hypothetical protein H0W88_02010 [Parachlamydiaceae bacterium]|nr:hypothetical protein [Parachlamydiaceae bacterium]